MPWIAAVVAGGAGLMGAGMQADAAGEASAAQAAATDRANAIQQKQYDTTRGDLAPYRGYGNASINAIMQRLGIGGTPGGAPSLTMEQARAQLMPQFTKQAAGGDGVNYDDPLVRATMIAQGLSIDDAKANQNAGGGVDEAGLSNAIAQLMASQPRGGDSTAPDYGSLLKPFTGADLANEPGYQFQMSEGQKALDRKAQAGGGYFSGAALKGAARFGQDLAGTTYNNSYNRDSSTKAQQYNFLSGGSSLGQNAAAMTGNAGTNMANSVGANTTALGNAVGASQIAQGNAYSGALTGASNAYNQNALMDRILGGNKSWMNLRTPVNPSVPGGYELDW